MASSDDIYQSIKAVCNNLDATDAEINNIMTLVKSEFKTIEAYMREFYPFLKADITTKRGGKITGGTLDFWLPFVVGFCVVGALATNWSLDSATRLTRMKATNAILSRNDPAPLHTRKGGKSRRKTQRKSRK